MTKYCYCNIGKMDNLIATKLLCILGGLILFRRLYAYTHTNRLKNIHGIYQYTLHNIYSQEMKRNTIIINTIYLPVTFR